MHVPNSGRLCELLRPQSKVWLVPASSLANRKTAFHLALVDTGEVLVSADARLPNNLLREAIDAGMLPEFSGYDNISQEVYFHDSRIDLVLSGNPERCYLEAKSVTLVKDGTGLFPDAPTVRGRKHLHSLVEAVHQGYRAAVAFVIQRSDARYFAPNEEADTHFCKALREAARVGVEVYAYTCSVNRCAVEIAGLAPVRM